MVGFDLLNLTTDVLINKNNEILTTDVLINKNILINKERQNYSLKFIYYGLLISLYFVPVLGRAFIKMKKVKKIIFKILKRLSNDNN